eukprot:gene10974-3047_t
MTKGGGAARSFRQYTLCTVGRSAVRTLGIHRRRVATSAVACGSGGGGRGSSGTGRGGRGGRGGSSGDGNGG